MSRWFGTKARKKMKKKVKRNTEKKKRKERENEEGFRAEGDLRRGLSSAGMALEMSEIIFVLAGRTSEGLGRL